MKNYKVHNKLIHELKGIWVIAKKDIHIYYLKAPVLIFGIVFPCFLFLAFAFGREVDPASLIPGLIGMTLFFTASSVGPIIFPWETRGKTLERLVSCPVSIQSILLGDVLAGFLFGIGISLVPFLLGILGLGMNVDNYLILILAILLSALCFSSLGVLLSSPPTDNPSNVMMLSNLVRLPLIFISGIFIPIDQLPTGGQITSLFSPLSYTTDLLRHTLQGSHCYPIALDLLLLLVFTGVFLTFGIGLHKMSLAKRI